MNQLGITGKIDSVAMAKRAVLIAAGACILLSLIWGLNGSFIAAGVTIPVVLFMAYRNARGAALMSFAWIFLQTAWEIIVVIRPVIEGRYLRLYMPVLCLITLWFLYRAIRATIFIAAEEKPDVNIETVKDVFE